MASIAGIGKWDNYKQEKNNSIYLTDSVNVMISESVYTLFLFQFWSSR